MESNTRGKASKSLFVFLGCGIMSFAMLVVLIRMPRPPSEETVNGDNSDLVNNAPLVSQQRVNRSIRDDSCKSSSCLKAASQLLNSMDQSIDPCRDFYSFACGGWMKKNPIPPSVSKWSPFGQLDLEINDVLQDILREPKKASDPVYFGMAKDFYKACSDTAQLEKVGLKPVFQMLQMYGGWPLLANPGTWNATSFDWMRSASDLKRMFGTAVILEVIVNQHSTNPAYSTIHLQQPTLFLSRPYLVNKRQFQPHVNAYKRLVVDIATELKKSPATSSFPEVSRSINEKYLNEKATEIIEFEEKIAKLTKDAVELQYGLRNNSATLPLNHLQLILNNYSTAGTINKLDLKRLLEYTFRTAGVRVRDVQLVSMSDTNYIGNIFELLAQTPSDVVANYLHFRMLGWLVSGTTSAMRGHIHKFQKVIYGLTEPSSRKYICASSTEEKFGLALTHPYLGRIIMGNEDIKNVTQIVEQIRSSFTQLLDSIKWMDPSVKGTLRKKARSITPCIGYASWMSPGASQQDKSTYNRQLNNHFKGLNIGTGSYLQKLWAVRTWLTDQKLKLLSERFDGGCKWTTFPGQVGAFYDIRRQAVNIPIGVMQPPFYFSGIPLAVTYGGLGSIIGHEFTHGFTVAGWTETENGQFSEISKCLIDQYNKFKVPEMNNFNINGVLTLDENFPDNGGLLEAFTTFKRLMSSQTFGQTSPQTLPGLEKFSQEQLFFLGFANIWCSSSRKEGLIDQVLQDHHTPNRYRVIGTLQNSREFATAWKCPSGSQMNPQKYKRCSAF